MMTKSIKEGTTKSRHKRAVARYAAAAFNWTDMLIPRPPWFSFRVDIPSTTYTINISAIVVDCSRGYLRTTDPETGDLVCIPVDCPTLDLGTCMMVEGCYAAFSVGHCDGDMAYRKIFFSSISPFLFFSLTERNVWF